MRTALFAMTILPALLSACGGPQTSQANNTQANMGASASPPATAAASSVQVSTTPVDKDAASQLMHQRHEAMEQLGKASKSIKRSLAATPINLTEIQQAAPPIFDTTAAKIVTWFPAGTGPDVGKTGAKPDIWKNPQDFAQKAQDYEAAAKKFGDSLRTFKPDEMKASFASLQNSCKACHDKYRAEMKH
ncbi:cytochrome c556 [Sphingomonas sp. F9_3S_D5_B_2]